VRQERLEQAVDLGLMDCIECSLCDQACPSDIPMAEIFGNAKWRMQRDLDDETTRQRFKARYEAHTQRLAAAEAAAAQRRQERLQRHRDTSRWQ
jgi:electron transport complex protein RnfC